MLYFNTNVGATLSCRPKAATAMNSRVGRLGGHSHDSRNLTFLFRSREATTHRVYLNEVDTPLRTILGATLFRSFLCAQSCDLSRPRILGRFVGLVLV